MEETCLTSSTVVASRNGEQVQNILSQSLEQHFSFINRDGRDRGSGFSKFDNMEKCLRSCQEGGVRVSLSSIWNFQIKKSFIEAVWDTISLIAVLPNLQKMNRGSTVILCPSDSCLQLARVRGENSVEQTLQIVI